VNDNLPAGRSTTEVEADPIANPGLPAHTWRPTDVDPHAEKRAERQVALLFGLSALCTLGFLVSYFALTIGEGGDTFLGLGASTVALGLFMSGAMLFMGLGIIQWARKLMSDQEITEDRHVAASPQEDRDATLAALSAGLEESGIGRRRLVRNSLLGAVALIALPPIVLLRDLGPLPGDALTRTIWTRGMRIARDVLGTPIRPSDMEIGDLINAEPEAIFEVDDNGEHVIEGAELQIAKSKSAVVVVRMEPDEIIPGPGRENWSVEIGRAHV